MAIDKRISYDVQGGVKNYLGKQKEVTAPVKWKSSPDHPETELAYITKAEKDLLVKKDLHGSLKGGVNRGPSGIMSLNGYGSTDPNQNVSGSQISAAETGSAGSGMSAKDRDDFRSAAIAAGAGQRVNPGFFDDRNTVSKAELARAKKFAPGAFRSTRGGGLMNLITGGGFLGNIVRGLGQKFGLGKRFNEPYDRPQFAPGFATNPLQMQYDVGNEDLMNLLKDENDEEYDTQLFNFGDTTVPSSSYDMAGVNTPFAQQAPKEFVSQFLPETDIYNQQTTRYQKRPEQVETDIFFRPQLQPEKNGILNFEVPGFRVEDKYVSDVAPEFQNMVMKASGTIGNYSQNAVSNQLYGKDYAVLDPFEQQQIDKAIETYGTKSTGELASGTDI